MKTPQDQVATWRTARSSTSSMVGVERRKEAVEGGHTHNGLHLVLFTVYTQTFDYINTCPVHREVHNNGM